LIFFIYAGERLISAESVSAWVSSLPDILFPLAAKQIAPNAIKTAAVMAYDIGASAMY
jgi:hypothetical protein